MEEQNEKKVGVRKFLTLFYPLSIHRHMSAYPFGPIRQKNLRYFWWYVAKSFYSFPHPVFMLYFIQNHTKIVLDI